MQEIIMDVLSVAMPTVLKEGTSPNTVWKISWRCIKHIMSLEEMAW